jgi:hypothetical protein
MLIPRFTIRWLLSLTTVCAFFFLIAGTAVNGKMWAVGVVTAVVTLLIAMLTYAFLFVWAFALARFFRSIRPNSPPASPFATDQLPPQVIPPQTLDS